MLASMMGWLDPVERSSIDWRFAHARWTAEPLSDQVALVAIDDRSLDTFGRWSSWPRTRLASVIDELADAGAKTIALDLILDERSTPDADAALGDAIARAGNVVLGVDTTKYIFDLPPWSETGEFNQRQRLSAELAEGLAQPSETIAEHAALTGDCRTAFLQAPNEHKRAFALFQTILPDENQEAFIRRLAGVGVHTGEFAERRMLEVAYHHLHSIQFLESRDAFPPLISNLHPNSHLDKLPLPEFVRGAESVGFVSVTDSIDSDRAVRAMSLAKHRSVDGFFSLAASATLYQTDERPGLLQLGPDIWPASWITPDARLSFSTNPLLIDWPTSPKSWLVAFPENAVVSIGYVLSLANQRTKLAAQLAELEALASEIAFAIGYDKLTDAVRAEVQDEIAFQLEAASSIEPESLSEEERDALALYQHHRQLSEAIAEGLLKIDEATAKLTRTVSGKLVFLGWAATGSTDADVIRTPLAPNTPGVFAHCVLADMLLTGRSRDLAPAWLAPLGALLLGVLCACAVALLPTAALGALASAIAIGAFLFIAGIYSFNEWRLVLPIAAPLGGGVGGWAAATAAAAFISQRDRARITRQFKARVDPALVDRLVNDPDSVSVSGVQREATIIFLDIAGFTTVAETLDSQRTVAILNRFMREMTRALTENGAYVNKFLGDGVMAFFSAFQPDPEQTARACRAALQCKRAIDTLNDIPDLADTPTLSARIGIATGLVTIGDCGSPPELNDYTAIGDAVNLAARLESAAKQFGVWSLIDQRTRDLAVGLGFDENNLDPLGSAVVVGRTEPTVLYTLPAPSESPGYRAARTEAINAFVSGDNERAAFLFQTFEREHGATKLTQLYLTNINAPDPPEDAVIRLTLK